MNLKKEIQQKAQPTILDKAISYFAPVYGERRMRSRMNMAITNAYMGASKSRKALKEWKTRSGDADSDANPDLPLLRERSRDLVRNAPLAQGAINTVCTNVIGPGLRLFPQIDRDALNLTEKQADQWERETKRQFNCWAESEFCHVQRTLDFFEIQDLMFRSTLESGDSFCMLPMVKIPKWDFRLALQIIESDRVSNPHNQRDTQSLSAGVEKSSKGVPIAYHVSRHHPGNLTLFSKDRKWDRIEKWGSKTKRKNVIHLFRTLRPGQTRGIPYLSPVIEPLKQLQRYTDAEIMAALVSGMFTVFVTTEKTTSDANPIVGMDGTNQDDYKLGTGSMVEMSPGEKIETANPGRPNNAFDPFVMAVLRQVGVSLEIPFEILIKHFTASYSAARGAILEAWKFFKSRRQWMARKFCNPIYEAWMEDRVSAGFIDAPGFLDDPIIRKAWLGAIWIGPAKGMIDEQKEIKAAELRLKNDLSTHEQETIELNGGDFENNIKQLGKERKLKSESRPQPDPPEEEEPEPIEPDLTQTEGEEK